MSRITPRIIIIEVEFIKIKSDPVLFDSEEEDAWREWWIMLEELLEKNVEEAANPNKKIRNIHNIGLELRKKVFGAWTAT